MKYVFLIITFLMGFSAKSQDKNVTYIKIESSGIRYSHIDSITKRKVIDNTIKKKITIYLEQQNQVHIIIKDAGKTIKYETTGFREYPEEATVYKHIIDKNFIMEVFMMSNSNSVNLWGIKGNIHFRYLITKADFPAKKVEGRAS